LTVSETSPQVEVEERARSLASECCSRQLHGAGRVLVRGRMGRSRLLRAAVRGRVHGPRRVRGAGPVQVLRRLEWHQLHCARGSHAPLRSRLRDSGATATAGAARSARRLSPRPTARATAGARAPERVGWEVAACEQPTCHPVCEHGTCTRHGERASCACFEGWQGVRCDERHCPASCQAHGVCTERGCVCSSPYTHGNDCSQPYCGADACSGHGRCALATMPAELMGNATSR
jgi:hypothetical protein